MGFSEFITPDKKKVILVFVLLIIGFISSGIESSSVILCKVGANCETPLMLQVVHTVSGTIADVLLVPIQYEPVNAMHREGKISNEFYYNRSNRLLMFAFIELIPNLIYLYALSCMINYAFYKN